MAFLLTRVFPSFLNNSSKLGPKLIEFTPNFHSLAGSVQNVSLRRDLAKPGGLFTVPTRTIVREHFPRPSERRRVKRHGWVKRMSTPEGRRILMNRILKGRWVYSH